MEECKVPDLTLEHQLYARWRNDFETAKKPGLQVL